MLALSVRFRRFLYELRTEGHGAGREAAAIGVGLFIGCLPLYGLHLLLCLAVSMRFGLNRLKTYLAANISNPFVAPWLLLVEVQAGAWLRRGSLHPLTVQTLETTGGWVFAGDLVAGSLGVGTALGGVAALATYALAGRDDRTDPAAALMRRAADLYAGVSILAWEFARGKLRHDPIYRALIEEPLLAESDGPGTERTLVDIGCGQGMALALLAEARRAAAGERRHAAAAPVFARLIGIEQRPRVAATAAAALRNEAEIIAGDARTVAVPRTDAVLCLDVLHMMPPADQEALLASLRASVAAGGVIVVREADAAAGWRFAMVSLGNRLKALVFGHWRQRFYFRSVAGWQACLHGLDLTAEVRPMGQGTPFANVVFVVRNRQVAPPNTRRTDTSNAAAP